MPTYVYRCDDCNHQEEHVHSMKDVNEQVHNCPECEKPMNRLITGGYGTIFRGDWPGKNIKRQSEDQKLQGQRRKAKRLKESGTVGWEEQIKACEADGLCDRMESEMRKKEVDKAKRGELDRQMDNAVSDE